MALQQSIWLLDSFYYVLRQNIENPIMNRCCFHIEIINGTLSYGVKKVNRRSVVRERQKLWTQFHKTFEPPSGSDIRDRDRGTGMSDE